MKGEKDNPIHIRTMCVKALTSKEHTRLGKAGHVAEAERKTGYSKMSL